MPEQSLQQLVDAVNPVVVRGFRETTVPGICYDSRAVAPGDMFFAIPGAHTDGHQYIQNAVDRGASAIIHSLPLDHYPDGMVCVQVADSRVALAQVSHVFYGRPADSMTLIGVTGTDGKSSTVYYIYQILRSLGHLAGFFSTVAMDTGNGIEKNHLRQSTPESPEIHRALASMVQAGYRYAVVETTSHGLSRKTARLHGLQFAAAVFTNLSHEHLEFHGSFERYRDDKANLFRALKDNNTSFGVVNALDSNSDCFAQATARPVFSYLRGDTPTVDNGLSTPEGSTRFPRSISLNARDCRFAADATECLLVAEEPAHDAKHGISVRVPFPAPFNVDNVLAAALTVMHLLQVPVERLVTPIAELQPVVGRMAPVTGSQPFTVLVDYAHSPGSFENVFPIFRRSTSGRLIAVFGSAGERDTRKRPIQGAIAARYADVLILADEDPRGEDPLSILRQIADGAIGANPSLVEGSNLYLIPDRTLAIHTALSIARDGDTVVMLGKGHEGNIIYRDHAIDWDEKLVAERQLEKLGYTVDTRHTATKEH